MNATSDGDASVEDKDTGVSKDAIEKDNKDASKEKEKSRWEKLGLESSAMSALEEKLQEVAVSVYIETCATIGVVLFREDVSLPSLASGRRLDGVRRTRVGCDALWVETVPCIASTVLVGWSEVVFSCVYRCIHVSGDKLLGFSVGSFLQC